MKRNENGIKLQQNVKKTMEKENNNEKQCVREQEWREKIETKREPYWKQHVKEKKEVLTKKNMKRGTTDGGEQKEIYKRRQ